MTTSASEKLNELSRVARGAAAKGDWSRVGACAREMIECSSSSAEGHFLRGLAEKAARRTQSATRAFSTALKLDKRRYDAAIELATLYAGSLRHEDALRLLEGYERDLGNSPVYLDMAANAYSRLGLHARAYPLYSKANELQPGIERLQAGLAACAAIVGRIDQARHVYQTLLLRNPTHQKFHYELSRLGKAVDASHLEQMIEVLNRTSLPADRNIFLYYAIGKELEDLERWQAAYEYYQRAGDAVTGIADYHVEKDIDLIDQVIDVCTADWLAGQPGGTAVVEREPIPIFVVGLPRSGTTLTERIISSHSQVESVDETFFMQIAVQRVSGMNTEGPPSPEAIRAASGNDVGRIASTYLDLVDYKLGGKLMFVEKLPENFLYLGFIAKAFPHARMILVNRSAMDVCFAMYKQSFFRYAYSLENLGRYYVAFDRLRTHWRSVLADRLIEVEYEALVTDFERQTRRLLDRLGLPFEQACLRFQENQAPSATASSAQVREAVHTGSVGRWRRFEQQLQPLRGHLESAGIDIR